MNTTNTPDRDEVIAELKAIGSEPEQKQYIKDAAFSAFTLLERDREDGKDRARLSWLEAMAHQKGGLLLHDGSESGRTGIGINPGNMIRTLRQAIDSAMATTTEKGEG